MSGDLPHWRTEKLSRKIGRGRKGYMRQLSSLSGFICSRAVLGESCVATLTKRTDQVFFPVLDSIPRFGICPQPMSYRLTVPNGLRSQGATCCTACGLPLRNTEGRKGELMKDKIHARPARRLDGVSAEIRTRPSRQVRSLAQKDIQASSLCQSG